MMDRSCDYLIEARHIAFHYNEGKPVFSDVCMQLSAGEIYTILGPNGAGKTTLLACLAGYLKPQAGQIMIMGQDILSHDARSLAQVIGYLPQIQALTVDFLVHDYLAFGCAPFLGVWRMPGKSEYERVEAIMERMQISHLASKPIQQISGGERQQVQIARVLVQRPNVIFMDEPTNHLDYGNQIKVLQIIAQLARDEGVAIVLTTHMPDQAFLLGGKTGIMDQTGAFISGQTAEIVTQDTLCRIYQTEICLSYVPQVTRVVCMPYNLT